MTEVLFLADFSVIKPDFGLFFWSAIIFIAFWLIMGKMAFKPIAEALKKREEDIQNSMDEAKRVRQEMQQLQAQNEALLAEAREERAKMLREAKETKEAIINDAKTKAKSEAQKIVANAKQEIENQKMAAMIDLKNQVGTMAIDIAEKILQKQLAKDKEQTSFVNKLVNDIKLN